MKMPATATIAALTLAPWVELISFVITLLEEQRKNIVDEIYNLVLLLSLIYGLKKVKGVCSTWCNDTRYNDTHHYGKLQHS